MGAQTNSTRSSYEDMMDREAILDDRLTELRVTNCVHDDAAIRLPQSMTSEAPLGSHQGDHIERLDEIRRLLPRLHVASTFDS